MLGLLLYVLSLYIVTNHSVCASVYVCACVRAHGVCVCVCVYAYVCVRACVRAHGVCARVTHRNKNHHNVIKQQLIMNTSTIMTKLTNLDQTTGDRDRCKSIEPDRVTRWCRLTLLVTRTSRSHSSSEKRFSTGL